MKGSNLEQNTLIEMLKLKIKNMRLKLCGVLLMMIISFSAWGQRKSPAEINLTLTLNSGYFLNELVPPGNMDHTCSMWTLQEFTLLDSLQNEIQKEVRWCRGVATITKQKLQFDGIKAASVYYLRYKNNGQLGMDTIRLKIIKSQEVKVEINIEELQRVVTKPTLIEQLAEGDTLRIKFSEYACNSTKGELTIIRKGEKYNAVLEETMGSIHKTFRREDIGKQGLAMIKAFEWDSRRPIFSNSCHDMGSFYTLFYKNYIVRIADFCGVWNGYYLLKKGLFKD